MRPRAAIVAAVLAALLCTGVAAATSTPAPAPVLAYEKGDQSPTVWIAGSGGQDPRRLGLGNEPAIAPNGAAVAAVATGPKGPALLLYSTSGGPTHSFFDESHVAVADLAWSADARYLAVALLGTSVNEADGAGLVVIDTSTWKTTTLAHGVIDGLSFDPAADELVYGLTTSLEISRPVDLHTVSVTGGATRQLTHDGHSLYPVWGARAIVFDRETSRGTAQAPEYELWTITPTGTGARQITHMSVPKLVDGLTPLAVDAAGDRLLAEFVGQDTSYAWTVNLASGAAAPLKVGGQTVQGAAISADGRTVLVDSGAFENAPEHGVVETVGFGGGRPAVLVRGAEQPSWTLGRP